MEATNTVISPDVFSFYILGPMRKHRNLNYSAFDLGERRLKEEAPWLKEIISPANKDREKFGTSKEVQAAMKKDPTLIHRILREDVNYVLNVDAVLMLPGWRESEGAQLEVTVAERIGLKLYELTEDESIVEYTYAATKIRTPFPEQSIVIDPETGGAKGTKRARFDLIPADSLWAIAEHYGAGAEKYGERNWEKGVNLSLYYAAMMRHANQWYQGEDIDPESGSHHGCAMAFYALAFIHYYLNGYEDQDDRPKKKAS